MLLIPSYAVSQRGPVGDSPAVACRLRQIGHRLARCRSHSGSDRIRWRHVTRALRSAFRHSTQAFSYADLAPTHRFQELRRRDTAHGPADRDRGGQRERKEQPARRLPVPARHRPRLYAGGDHRRQVRCRRAAGMGPDPRRGQRDHSLRATRIHRADPGTGCRLFDSGRTVRRARRRIPGHEGDARQVVMDRNVHESPRFWRSGPCARRRDALAPAHGEDGLAKEIRPPHRGAARSTGADADLRAPPSRKSTQGARADGHRSPRRRAFL